MGYKILCDSCTDFTPEMLADPCYARIPLTIYAGDREFVDDGTIVQSELLDAMKASSTGTKTACPSPAAYMSHFEDAEDIYIVTLSARLSGSYNAADQAVKCYLASQMELEKAVESLVNQLEEAGKLDDTVIVLSADHYPYGLTDEEYSELYGHPVDPVFEIYENGLILWSADLEEPVHVDKYCSSLDVMPTLANLFGLEYDSRLMAGRDILSDEPGLVIFSNYSFLTDQGAYDSTTDTFIMFDGSQPDPEYVAERVAEVQNRVAYSAAILDWDYYRVVLGDG